MHSSSPVTSQIPASAVAAAPLPLATIDGWGITVASPDEAIRTIIARARNAESFTVNTLNLDHLVKLRRDGNFRAAYRSATIVTADGAPIVWLARRQGVALQRTTGADLVVPLLVEAARHQLPVYLFGTSDAVLQDCQTALRGLTDASLNICGAVAPPQGFDGAGPAADAAIAAIRLTGARLVLVALGAPKQEIFAARARAAEVGAGLICVGAALDFIVGVQTRAPAVFKTYGLEWAWRLATNPRRLATRYARCALVLADLAIVQPLHRRLTTRAAT